MAKFKPYDYKQSSMPRAFGEGQEHHSLKPVIVSVFGKYKQLGIVKNLFETGRVFTADTGFANESNMG